MSARLTVKDWRRLVFASQASKMTPAVKVLCLYLADHMDAHRVVRVPRGRIAEDLGVHEQRVAERFKGAVDGGFLVHVAKGHTGRTAVYQGTRPDVVQARDCVRQSGTQSGAEERTDSRDALGHAERYAVGETAERESRGVRTALLDASVGKAPNSGESAACPWHEFVACPADCANYVTGAQRRSA